MASKNGFTRRRIGVIAIGSIILIFLSNVILTGGQDLFLANPFDKGIDFRQISTAFRLFSVANAPELVKYVKGTQSEILDKNCYIKLRTDVVLDTGRVIPLDSPFQTIGALTPFSLTTPSGTQIKEFRHIELRMRCDLTESLTGQRLEFEVVPRPLSPMSLYVYGYNQQGQHPLLKGGSLKPEYALTLGDFLISIPSTAPAILINPDKPVVFSDSQLPDPNSPAGTLLYATSERTISKPVNINAGDIETAIEKSTTLSPKTFSSEIMFTVSGSFDLNYPYLQSKGLDYPHQIPLDQGAIINRFDLIVTEPTTTTPITSPTALTSKIASISPTILSINGQAGDFKYIYANVEMNNYDAVKEGRPTGEMRKILKDLSNVDAFTTATSICSPQGTGGVTSRFVCTFAVQDNIEVGSYIITIKTLASNRPSASKSINAVMEGAPVGTGCPEGQAPDSLGICRLFGSTGGGGGLTGCPQGQTKNDFGQCIVPPAGTGGIDPTLPACEIQGEERDTFGVCRSIKSEGGVGTKSCTNCQQTVIRTVASADVCPVFLCPDGTNTSEDGIPNCADKKPAYVISAGNYSCDRIVGLLGGLLPILVDCQGENRKADIAKGELCAPAWVIGVFSNILLILIIVIILIIVFAIISAILKKRSQVLGI